jgi:hypothetical protein
MDLECDVMVLNTPIYQHFFLCKILHHCKKHNWEGNIL